jgi:hypothetical protein
MPYIEAWRRVPETISQPETASELNYLLTWIVDDMLVRRGVSYTNINAIVGVLECVKLELYRRVAAPYEDQKRVENGDVYRSSHGSTAVEY